jgi:hypothetical protein
MMTPPLSIWACPAFAAQVDFLALIAYVASSGS